MIVQKVLRLMLIKHVLLQDEERRCQVVQDEEAREWVNSMSDKTVVSWSAHGAFILEARPPGFSQNSIMR